MVYVNSLISSGLPFKPLQFVHSFFLRAFVYIFTYRIFKLFDFTINVKKEKPRKTMIKSKKYWLDL